MSLNKSYWTTSNTFDILLKVIWLLVILLLIMVLVMECQRCNYYATIVDKTGYLPDNDDWDNIPDVVPPYKDEDSLNMLDRVSLERFFPPIGNQGEKGTCVAWAVGYNLKTALNAIENKWDSVMLTLPENQTSPKDLWFSIPQSQKGMSCSGTGFEAAFDALMMDGAASMENVPYQDLQDCSGMGIGDTINRIGKYYQVTGNGQIPSIGQIKSLIADTIPLVVGVRLGDRFMKWNDDKVISSDTYNYTGMHAYNAIALVGYDDNRHAFRLRNSWGTGWGDNGSIWVDYDFFLNVMCYAVLMAENRKR